MGLVAQWQDHLAVRFGIEFDIVTRDLVEASQIGNPFAERNLLIARLDHLARNDDLRERLRARRSTSPCFRKHRRELVGQKPPWARPSDWLRRVVIVLTSSAPSVPSRDCLNVTGREAADMVTWAIRLIVEAVSKRKEETTHDLE